MRRLAYGAAGNYAVQHAIRAKGARSELAGLFTYRRIVVRKDVSSTSPAEEGLEISIASSALLTLEDIHPEHDQEYLVPSPLEFPQGLIYQYAQWHHGVDLFDYVCLAERLGIIGPADVDEFARETIFIPGGCELGIYPASWLEATLRKLALIGREFLTRHGERILTYDKYQVRAVGFLSERLGSYLLIKELRNRYPGGIPHSIFGDMCVIVPDGTHYSPGVADE
jgi:hypothetical protein